MEPRQFQPLPLPIPQLYTLLVKKKMITPIGPRTRIRPQPKDYNKDLTCEYHRGEVGHTIENCKVLRHRIQDLLDQGVLKFRVEGIVNAIGAEKSDEVDTAFTKIPWEPLFHELRRQGLLTIPRTLKESAEAGVQVSFRSSRPQPTKLRRIQKGGRQSNVERTDKKKERAARGRLHDDWPAET